MSEKTYDGQTASFLSAVVTCMPKGMSGEVMQGWIQNPKALKKVLAELYPPVFDPNEFFRTRKGLWISEDFRKFILPVTKKTVVSSGKLKSFDLTERMNDVEIRSKLGNNHVWEDASECCSQLAGMINLQSNGKEGDLLNNGHASIFYVRGKNSEVFVVNVYWGVDDRRWGVYACRLGVYRWCVGFRAFSCNSTLNK